MSKLYNKIKPFFFIFQIKTGLSLKVEYLIILFKSIFEFMLRNKPKQHLQKIFINKFQWKIFNIQYGVHKLFLTIDEIFQGLHFIERESYIQFENLIEPGDIVCDVGAHIGTHTLKMANLVGSDGIVIALEPNLKNFGLLSLNITQNKYSNYVKLINAALACRCAKVRLDNPGNSMYFSLTRKSDNFEEVDALTFDKLFEVAGVNYIKFLKIDVEGAEEKLILSETKTFQKNLIKILYIDTHIGVNYDLIIEHLTRFNYHHKKVEEGYLFYLDENHNY
jgi:FkbM family methyltransferase